MDPATRIGAARVRTLMASGIMIVRVFASEEEERGGREIRRGD
jgi:hypothetical protein